MTTAQQSFWFKHAMQPSQMLFIVTYHKQNQGPIAKQQGSKKTKQKNKQAKKNSKHQSIFTALQAVKSTCLY